jgi:DNA (cytosine-5)-methyltransferase 1
MSLVFDIRTLRQMSGVRQRDLAAAVGLSVHELMKIERGLQRIDEPFLRKICHALRIDYSDLGRAASLLTNPACGEGYITARPACPTTVRRRESLAAGRKPIIDLFCGIGGFSFGFEMTEKFQVIAGVDLLGDRLTTFMANHPTANAYGQDIRSLETDILDDENPRPFVIVGGPPCQGFSSIRPFRNVEWNDPRNNLAEEYCRIVADLRPEWIVFENVVGMVVHDDGCVLRAILDSFQDIGYRTSARVLNAAHFGLPQRRERLVIVGSLRNKPFKWPEPTHWVEHRSMLGDSAILIQPERGLFGTPLQDAITVDQAIHDLPAIAAGESATQYDDTVEPTEYERSMRNSSNVLTLHNATAHSKEMIEIIKRAGTNINALPTGMVTSGFSSCYSRLSGNEPSVTLTVNFVHPSSNRCIHPYQDRALTPREGARLQGFLDTFEIRGTRSQIAKQIGNAVPPLLGRLIAESILASD